MLGNAKVSGMIPVTDFDRAKKFYVDTLGLKMETEMDDQAAFLESGGGMISFYVTADNAGKSPATLAGWAVSDIESVVDELNGKGITMEQYPDFKTNEKGIAQGPGPKAAWFKDPDGNILALFEGPA